MRKYNYVTPVTALALAVHCACYGLSIDEPSAASRSTFEVVTPEDGARTLKSITFEIDLSAQSDGLEELKARRAGLTLAGERPATIFAHDASSGVILAGAAPIARIAIVGSQVSDSGHHVSAIFYNDRNEIISPSPRDVSAFDTAHQRLRVDYKPMSHPAGLRLPVQVLIDTSGSVHGAMPELLSATRAFLRNLPNFTDCEVWMFAENVKRLTPDPAGGGLTCNEAQAHVPSSLPTGQATALNDALAQALVPASTSSGASGSGIAQLVVVLTDGINTVQTHNTLPRLQSLKRKSGAKIIVFWSGAYDAAALRGLADAEMISKRSVKDDLEEFFISIGVSVSGIQTLHARGRPPK